MPDYKAPLDDIRFLLHQVFDLDGFCRQFPELEDCDRDTSDAILEEASKVCEQLLAPIDVSGDKQGCEWRDGNVYAPEGYVDAYQRFSEGAWGALGGDPEYGGMGMPKTLVSAVEEMVQGANMAFGLAPMLTAGACLAIRAHPSDALKAQYLPKMYSGEWSGAMDLTEAHAGTDLGLMRSKAIPNDDESYSVTGSKIFITWGEHDLASNIIHLVLAKLPGAPTGSKGISLFLVPKYLPDTDGDAAEANGVSCGSIEHKMGIHGSATCVMNFDHAKGWLVGEPHKGLACMFTMMNYERLVVGIQGIGVAENAYQCAREYALERLQGRSPVGAIAPEKEADPIIVHPDVRRMLLEMKSMNEASRAFYIYVAQWLDRAKYASAEEEKRLAEERVALLTPVAKAFMTDRAFEACVLGQQVLGGHGYIQEWGQEQHVRDVRITQIYEGTNGVQAMDLAGRKTVQCDGALLSTYLSEMREALDQHQSHLDDDIVKEFERVLHLLDDTTQQLIAQKEPALVGAVAVDYLDFLGFVSFAYMWVLMMAAASQGETHTETVKMKTGRFYFYKMLPKLESLSIRIKAGHDALMAFESDDF